MTYWHTVDGRNPKVNHLGCALKPCGNNGISATNLNWWLVDFWSINPWVASSGEATGCSAAMHIEVGGSVDHFIPYGVLEVIPLMSCTSLRMNETIKQFKTYDYFSTSDEIGFEILVWIRPVFEGIIKSFEYFSSWSSNLPRHQKLFI